MLNLSDEDNVGDNIHSSAPPPHVSYRLTEVLIVDDGSSLVDKQAMLAATQRCTCCTLIFKGECTSTITITSYKLIFKVCAVHVTVNVTDDI
jgi:hypothetical protein